MSEASESIATEESQPAADVDALLNQVEALAEEIATETDAGKPASDSTAPPVTGEFEDAQTDTESAPPDEPAESASEELNDLLHDPDAPAKKSVDPVSSPVESNETESSEVDQECESPTVEGEAQNPDPADTPTVPSDPEAGATDPAVSPARLPIRQRILSAVKKGPKAILAAKVVPIILVNTVLKVLLTIDLPFANWSPGKKRITGFVAIATVVVGILSWILPDLLNHNPFADMDAHTVIGG